MKEITKKAIQERNSFKTIKIKEDSYLKLKFISKLLNEPYCDTISSIVDQIWELFATFKTVESVEYERRVLANTLTITLFGDKRIFANMLRIPEGTSNKSIDKLVTEDILSQKLQERL